MIQSWTLEVDASRAQARKSRSGLGAALSDDRKRVVMQRTDYVPSAPIWWSSWWVQRGLTTRGAGVSCAAVDPPGPGGQRQTGR